MQPYHVTEILGEPEQMKLVLDNVAIVYWGVKVKMMGEGLTIESIVTFDKIGKAKKLRVGDVFDR